MPQKTHTFTLLVTVRAAEAGSLSHNEFAFAVEQLLKGRTGTVSPLSVVMVDAFKGIHANTFDQVIHNQHRHADF